MTKQSQSQQVIINLVDTIKRNQKKRRRKRKVESKGLGLFNRIVTMNEANFNPRPKPKNFMSNEEQLRSNIIPQTGIQGFHTPQQSRVINSSMFRTNEQSNGLQVTPLKNKAEEKEEEKEEEAMSLRDDVTKQVLMGKELRDADKEEIEKDKRTSLVKIIRELQADYKRISGEEATRLNQPDIASIDTLNKKVVSLNREIAKLN